MKNKMNMYTLHTITSHTLNVFCHKVAIFLNRSSQIYENFMTWKLL